MKIHNWVGDIFWLIIGVYMIIGAYHLGTGHLHQPGPGLIFFLAACLLTILSIIDLARTSIWKPNLDKDEKEDSVWSGVRWQKILLVMGGLFAYAYFFNILGFLLCTFLLMIFLFKVVEPTRWLIAVASTIVTMSLSYLLFQVWLKVPFPVGFWGG